LFPGPGYGGSCFPKDVQALVRAAAERDVNLQVLEAVESVNDQQKRRLFEKLHTAMNGDLRGKRIAVWGLAFKPNTDDMREAPALVLIDQLLEAGAEVVAHDPVAMTEARRRIGDRIEYAESNYAAIEGADALVVVTEWNQYRNPDFERIQKDMRGRIVIDGRNLYDPSKLQRMGFTYDCFGRLT